MDRTTASRTTLGMTAGRTPEGAGDRNAAGRVGERGGAGRAAGQARPRRAPHPTGSRGTADRVLVCSGCGGPGRTRDEAADLAVDWLVIDTSLVVDTSTDPTSGTAHTARFHQACRPAGIPGELACAGCGDGPLLDPTLTAVLAGSAGAVDLFTAAALTGWLDAHGWTGGDPHPGSGAASELKDMDLKVGEGPRCPACSPRPARVRRNAAAGAAR